MLTVRPMGNRGVIIATNAIFFACLLKEKFMDCGLTALTASSEDDLTEKMKTTFIKFIFIENCFLGHGTDVLVHRMVKRNRHIRIVVWAACEVKPVTAARFIAAGAESFVSLREDESNIDKAIKNVSWGQRYFSADVKEAIEKRDDDFTFDEKLTQREIQIMKMSCENKTNKELGDILSISINTIKMHKKNIYRKCGGNTPVDILINGLRKGVINVEDIAS
jgi:DNA-binding NarL/FixJ family response regulator